MSEFDFEEIDKAVNGALQPQPTDEPAPSPTPTDTPAARRASGGRFMDLVHPSSDMRSPTPSATSAAPQAAPQPMSSPAASAPSQPQVAVPTDDTAPTTAPLESPFLPGAKVEKRPLGGDSSMSMVVEAPVEPSAAAPIETPEAVPTDTVSPDVAFPDPMDFPSNHSEPIANEAAAQGAPESTATESTPEPVAPTPPITPAEPLPSEAQSEVLATASIPQQYQEQATTTQQSGAVYDTEAYHQPIAPAPKKRSGAWVVLWIFLLIIFGAAIGAAVYFYVIPLL